MGCWEKGLGLLAPGHKDPNVVAQRAWGSRHQPGLGVEADVAAPSEEVLGELLVGVLRKGFVGEAVHRG
jgi:hypothetical protein